MLDDLELPIRPEQAAYYTMRAAASARVPYQGSAADLRLEAHFVPPALLDAISQGYSEVDRQELPKEGAENHLLPAARSLAEGVRRKDSPLVGAAVRQDTYVVASQAWTAEVDRTKDLAASRAELLPSAPLSAQAEEDHRPKAALVRQVAVGPFGLVLSVRRRAEKSASV